MLSMTSQELLVIGIGFLISLLAEYLPVVQGWFGKLLPWQKFVLILVFNIAAGVGTYVNAEWGVLSWAGAGQAAWLAFLAFMSSLSTHMVDKARKKM